MERKTYTTEEIERKFASLPEEIKALLYSPQMLNVIKGIGEKHRLHVDQVGLLEAETSEVMLGLVEAKDYSLALSESLGMDRQKADAIAKDINDQLFVKIRDAMKLTYEQQKTENEKPTVPTPPTPGPPTPAPQVKPVVPPHLPPAQKPPTITPADLALSQKTVSLPSKPAASGELLASSPSSPNQPVVKPPPYKADPYREPAE